jgi:hypothetical protein
MSDMTPQVFAKRWAEMFGDGGSIDDITVTVTAAVASGEISADLAEAVISYLLGAMAELSVTLSLVPDHP